MKQTFYVNFRSWIVTFVSSSFVAGGRAYVGNRNLTKEENWDSCRLVEMLYGFCTAVVMGRGVINFVLVINLDINFVLKCPKGVKYQKVK